MTALTSPSVTFVITSLSLGGTEGQFARLAVGLHSRGYHVRVVCLQNRTATVDWLRAKGVAVEVCDAARGHFIRRAAVLVRAVLRLWWQWRRHPPDIVHGVLAHGYLLAGVATRLAPLPVFVSSRRSLSHFKARRPGLRLLERMINRHTSLVIANSEAVRRDAIRTESLPAALVDVIYNGVAPRLVAEGTRHRVRRQLGTPADARVAMCVANLIHYKGHDVLVSAWHKVVDVVPTAVLWLVGDGPERAQIASLVADHRLRGSVVMLGRRTDVPDLLSAADLLVHASRQEGFCNAVLEGMASGLPTVATDVGGNAEAVQHDVTGLLVPADNADQLAAAIVRLLRDAPVASRMGLAGERRVAERFSEEHMIQAYDEVYRRLLSERQRIA